MVKTLQAYPAERTANPRCIRSTRRVIRKPSNVTVRTTSEDAAKQPDAAIPQQSEAAAPEISPVRRGVYLTLAAFFLMLGICGALLPLLPTTPFLLLTSYFLAKSSPRLNQMLLRSRLLGPVLVDWQVHGGVRPRVRWTALTVVMIAVGVSLYLSGYTFWPAVTVISLASIGIGVILCLPSAKPRD